MAIAGPGRERAHPACVVRELQAGTVGAESGQVHIADLVLHHQVLGLRRKDMEPTDCYVARKFCGCVVAWASDDLGLKEISNIVRDWIKEGLIPERHQTEWARKTVRRCKCSK